MIADTAPAVGASAGLEDLSRELAQRGDRDEAERLTLCAVNMAPSGPWVNSRELAWEALADARGDQALLTQGLDADGSTAVPW